MIPKLVVLIMGQDNLHDLKICFDSVKEADTIVYCDGGSQDGVDDWLAKENFLNGKNYGEGMDRVLIKQDYDQDDPFMNGKQRNFYLDFLKTNFLGWWCLVLDCDEVLSDDGIKKIKSFIGDVGGIEDILYNVHMRHLQYSFAQEDATTPQHFVPRRLFCIRKELSYPEVEHPMLMAEGKNKYDDYNGVTLWHLPYARMRHVKSRYEKNLLHSNIHNKEFLDSWYRAHLFGGYPSKVFDPKELPSSLLLAYHIHPDELYFRGRGLETKHFIDASHWKELIGDGSVLEFGCGLGPRVYAMRSVGLDARGQELSRWAVDNSLAKGSVAQGDITKLEIYGSYDLTIAYDVLEHILEADLAKAIVNLIDNSRKYVLVSVPFVGDPNLYKTF